MYVLKLMETPMHIIMLTIATVSMLVAVIWPALGSILPWLGPGLFHHMQAKRTLLLAISAGVVLWLSYARLPVAIILAAAWLLSVVIAYRVLVPWRAIRAVDSTVPHPDPGAVDTDDKVLVLEHHAYPLRLLIPHHLINDEINGHPVLISWCALCVSGIAYDRRVDGQPLTFKVGGVWNRNMVILDERTGSVWQQDTGECLAGPMSGKRLQMLAAELTTWGAYREENPGTLLMDGPPGAPDGIMKRDSMYKMFQMTRRFTTPGLTRLDRRLDPHAEVAGITMDGVTKAYPIESLMETGSLTDTVGASTVTLSVTPGGAVRAVDEHGNPILVRREWWVGFSTLYPDTHLWMPDARRELS